MHFAVAGNIGSGKTTLTELLSKNLKWNPHFEDVANNPYLDDFYNNMEMWSFNLQIYFLGTRIKQIKEIQASGKSVIQDRTIYEDAYIFAANLHDMGLMMTRDYENYLQIFQLMESFISPPDLLIYLRADVPTLVKHIHLRGREYEASISIEYLSRLNKKYESWIEGYTEGKLLIVDVNELDFVNKEEDLGTVISKIQAETAGLF